MNNTLNLLGLARRGGNLAMGEEPVAEACKLKKAQLVFLANDAGETIARRGRGMAESAGVPCAVIPCTKAELGFALGRATCALIAVTDRGLARAVLQKLAAADEGFRPMAEQLADRKERRQQNVKRNADNKTSVDR